MKIIIRHSTDSEDLGREEMEIDGKEVLFVRALCECPEDATIERDLVSCSQVAGFMRIAYEAGKKGEEFEVEKV